MGVCPVNVIPFRNILRFLIPSEIQISVSVIFIAACTIFVKLCQVLSCTNAGEDNKRGVH